MSFPIAPRIVRSAPVRLSSHPDAALARELSERLAQLSAITREGLSEILDPLDAHAALRASLFLIRKRGVAHFGGAAAGAAVRLLEGGAFSPTGSAARRYGRAALSDGTRQNLVGALRLLPSGLGLQEHVLATLAPRLGRADELPSLVDAAFALAIHESRRSRNASALIARALTRSLARASGDDIRGLSETQRQFLVDRVRGALLFRRLSNAVIADVFDISPNLNPQQNRGYEWDFVIVALLALGDSGADEIAPTAEQIARRHPFESVRAAAQECLSALHTREMDAKGRA